LIFRPCLIPSDFFGVHRKKVPLPLGGRKKVRSTQSRTQDIRTRRNFPALAKKLAKAIFLIYDKTGKLGLSESEKNQDLRKPVVYFAPSWPAGCSSSLRLQGPAATSRQHDCCSVAF
jgi:hypothetical protein